MIFSHLYRIKHLKKYLFAIVVSTYVLTATGIPVYLHYCGGELEEISYLTKANSCCGDEDTGEDSDCCKNESHILKNSTDFVSKTEVSSLPLQSCVSVFFLSKLFQFELNSQVKHIHNYAKSHSPPRPEQDSLLEITVLRI